jgi:hypothetical protein
LNLICKISSRPRASFELSNTMKIHILVVNIFIQLDHNNIIRKHYKYCSNQNDGSSLAYSLSQKILADNLGETMDVKWESSIYSIGPDHVHFSS